MLAPPRQGGVAFSLEPEPFTILPLLLLLSSVRIVHHCRYPKENGLGVAAARYWFTPFLA